MGRSLIVIALTALALPTAAGAACNQYFILGSVGPLVSTRQTDYVHLDERGIPVVEYAFGRYESPFVTAEWGLQNYSWWCRRQFADDGSTAPLGHRAPQLREALRMADYLVAIQSNDGAWYYGFPFRAGEVELRPPWPSAISQGVALSLLTRAYSVTRHQRYLRAIRRALLPYARPLEQRGVRTFWNGHPWYEEYPGPGAQHVLNGFEFGLVGLHDATPYSRLARTLFRDGIKALVAALPLYDLGASGSSYGYRWGVASYGYSGYLFWHILLGRALYYATGERVLAYYADRWKKVLAAHGYEMQ